MKRTVTPQAKVRRGLDARWPWKAALLALLASLFLLTATPTAADKLPAASVPSSGTQDVHLRLTTPISSSSTKEHTATVTVVAVAP